MKRRYFGFLAGALLVGGKAFSGVESSSADLSGFDYRDQIELSAAQQMTQGTPSVKVAIILSGVNHGLPELKDSILRNAIEEAGRLGFDDDDNGYMDDVLGFNVWKQNPDVWDELGIGTQVASLIHEIAPGVKLLPIKAVSNVGASTDKVIARGVEYALAREAQVIYIGMGGRVLSEHLCEAIREATERGASVIVPSGNEGGDSVAGLVPASCPVDDMIVVTASNENSSLASFATYDGTHVDLAAPGVKIEALNQHGEKVLSSGSTYSSAITTGTVALMKSLRPDLNPTDIRWALLEGVDVQRSLAGKVLSSGRLNARRALEALQRL